MYNLTEEEELLIELIQLLAFGKVHISKKGTRWMEPGLSSKEIKHFLTKPLSHKQNQTALQCLRKEGRAFINEIISHLNKHEN